MNGICLDYARSFSHKGHYAWLHVQRALVSSSSLLGMPTLTRVGLRYLLTRFGLKVFVITRPELLGLLSTSGYGPLGFVRGDSLIAAFCTFKRSIQCDHVIKSVSVNKLQFR